ncbi:MAG: hypothetical protein HUK22_01180 [Thermoguttaceae bacterium]|nr:hypothetical protein [Thermoguttaceae bacterium]
MTNEKQNRDDIFRKYSNAYQDFIGEIECNLEYLVDAYNKGEDVERLRSHLAAMYKIAEMEARIQYERIVNNIKQ